MPKKFAALLCIAVALTCGSRSRRITVSGPTMIDGVPCTNPVRIRDGKLYGCRLAADYRWGEVTFAKGTIVYVHEDWMVVRLNENRVIQDVKCRGGTDGAYSLHPNGKLRSCTPDGDQMVGGLLCTGYSFRSELSTGGYSGTQLYFHDNGQLARCRLARDETIAGRPFPKGSRIELRRDGTPVIP